MQAERVRRSVRPQRVEQRGQPLLGLDLEARVRLVRAAFEGGRDREAACDRHGNEGKRVSNSLGDLLLFSDFWMPLLRRIFAHLHSHLERA